MNHANHFASPIATVAAKAVTAYNDSRVPTASFHHSHTRRLNLHSYRTIVLDVHLHHGAEFPVVHAIRPIVSAQLAKQHAVQMLGVSALHGQMEVGLVALQPAAQRELADAKQFVVAFPDVSLPSLFAGCVVEQSDCQQFLRAVEEPWEILNKNYLQVH